MGEAPGAEEEALNAMPEAIGIDHIYLTVSDLVRSEAFYDGIMGAFGFRKSPFAMAGETHVHYYNRHFGFVLRPARSKQPYNSYAPGLHHLCFRVETAEDVTAFANLLKAAGIGVSQPRLYAEYAPDYFACFFDDPDGIRLEVTNYRAERRDRHDHWAEHGDY